MHFVDRKFVCDALKVSRWQSYQLVKPRRMAMVSTDDIISLLNESSVNEATLSFVPSDIASADDVERELGIPSRKLLLWSNRTRPIPHFRINKHTRRYRISSVRAWISERS